MEFEEIAWQLSKLLGFIMIATSVAMAAWNGLSIGLGKIIMFTFGLSLSIGSIILHKKEQPTETELRRMYEKELDQLYIPASYRTFDRKRAGYEAEHRLREMSTAVGDFSEQKGH